MAHGDKGSDEAFDWMPEKNKRWFANRVVAVKAKYGMTVDREEAEALELVLADCASVKLIKEPCAV